jgi:RNA polymerase-binding transcription factor DksA
MSTTIIRYSDEELVEFKALIDEKMAIAKQELEFMKDQIMEMNENASEKQGGNWFDDSSVHTELEMLNNMVIRQQQFVNNLENALIRIQNKTYGICMVTGQLIDKKRLMLVPHATKSVIAKEIENAEKAKIEAMAKAEKDSSAKSIDREVETKEVKTPKIITKIVKKPVKSTGKAAPVKEDDLDDLELELDMDDDADYDSNIITGMDMDDIADDQDYFDK